MSVQKTNFADKDKLSTPNIGLAPTSPLSNAEDEEKQKQEIAAGTAQSHRTRSKEDEEQSKVSKKEIDDFLSRYDNKFDRDDEQEKARKRERARIAIELFINAINDLYKPLIDKLDKNKIELDKLHALQKKDPGNPDYLRKEAKLLTEKANLLGNLIKGERFLAERGVLFKGIADKLPPNMQKQHQETNERLKELGVPLPLSEMDQFLSDMKDTASFLIQQVMAVRTV